MNLIKLAILLVLFVLILKWVMEGSRAQGRARAFVLVLAVIVLGWITGR